ncbi:conserved hypothetical protein [Staphylococcus capitis]|nr:conserved hypothetical protein [Staphylococcus capitis]
MERHVFYAHGNYYELVASKDCFGCETVCIYENDCYRGLIDTADSQDFLKIEHKIVMYPEFIDSPAVWA